MSNKEAWETRYPFRHLSEERKVCDCGGQSRKIESVTKEQNIDTMPTRISEKLYSWMSNLKIQDRDFLPVDVLCDYDGMMRFKKAMAEIIKQEL